MLYTLIKYVIGPVIMLILRGKTYCREKLGVEGPAIFVSNHLALLDPVMIAVMSPRTVHFMGKKELFESRIGRLFFKSLQAFPVNRHTADLASVKQALEVLKKGEIFGIFPEGKRSVTGELDELEKGAAFLALRSGTPVIPVFIHPDSYRKFRFRAIVGDPICRDALSLNRSEAIDQLTERMKESMVHLRTRLEEEIKCR